MRPVELGPSPAASEVLAPMATKVRATNDNAKSEATDNGAEHARTEYSQRAAQLSREFALLARRILELDEPAFVRATRTIDRIRAGLDGHGIDPEHLARVQLLDAINDAIFWAKGIERWRAIRRGEIAPKTPHDLETANFFGVGEGPVNVVAIARRNLRNRCPEYAARLTDEDLRMAIEVWNKRGRPKAGSRLPNKWEYLQAMLERVGLPGINSLEQDWHEWRRKEKASVVPGWADD